MKKILIVIVLFVTITSLSFADTIRVFKQINNEVQIIEYNNMKTKSIFQLKDNEYYVDERGTLVYRIGKNVYRTSMFEIEYEYED